MLLWLCLVVLFQQNMPVSSKEFFYYYNSSTELVSRVHDALLSQFTSIHHIEDNLSTYSDEVLRLAMISSINDIITFKMQANCFVDLSTDQTLVLIDESGRGTSPQDGIGISFAIAEFLIREKVRSFI